MPPAARTSIFNALIRTHHITSRKKVAKLKQAARTRHVFALIRYGGAPGIMYVEGGERGVEEWVDVVQRLRYKDHQLVARPAIVQREEDVERATTGLPAPVGLYETETVKDFGLQMQARGVYGWWRRAMGYTGDLD